MANGHNLRLPNAWLSPLGLRVKLATFRYHRGQLKQETVTVQPIKGRFKKASSARDIEEDMHSEAYLHLPKTAN